MESVRTSSAHYIAPGQFLLVENALGNPDLIQSNVSSDCQVTIVDKDNFPLDELEQWPSFRLRTSNIKLTGGEGSYYIYVVVPTTENELQHATLGYSTKQIDRDGYEVLEEGKKGSLIGPAHSKFYPMGTVGAKGSAPDATTSPAGKGRKLEVDLGMTPPYTNIPGNVLDYENVFQIDKVDPTNPNSWLLTILSVVKTMTARVIKITEKIVFGSGENEKYVNDIATSADVGNEKVKNDHTIATTGWVNAEFVLLEDKFIRKDKEDSTNFLLSLLGGTLIKKFAKFGEFITGVSGGYIDEKGNMEMESGVFRKRLFVPEIAYNRTTYFKGRMVNSPGGGCTVLSYVDNGNGTYTITPDLTDADGLSQFVDDILTTYFVTKNAEGKLNGFEEMKFRVTAADYTEKKFTVMPRPGYNWKPAEQMVLAHTGNFTDEERQTYILIDSVNGNNCITFFDHANTWDPEPAQMPSWFGKKKGMTINGIDCENYSAVLQNIIMTGLIWQVDEITGQNVRVPLDKGDWVAGKYGYYDRVNHNGSLWLCVNDKGTTAEPSSTSPDWLEQVKKGIDGKDGAQGVPGTPGKDGVTYYTWIRYADNSQGGGISNNPTGKEYIGFAYNKTTATESNNPSDYTWSLIKGTDGVPGAPGADGKTTYTWIAYSDNADGSGMYQLPKETTKYIGIAVNKDTATESNTPSDYTWSLFKGADGADGKDGVSIVGGGHWESSKTPYAANTMVSLANSVFLSKVKTSNPPLRIMIANGGYLRKSDGGYIFPNNPSDWQVHPDWDLLLDGRELKGDSITFLGEFASHPANPKNGDSYHNTTDNCTYIYRDGVWMVMTQDGTDGKDGKSYEWIYQRGNIINLPPDKPDSQQTDDYVPDGWTDDFLGVDADHQVEWACKRVKKDGVWSEFSEPAVVHRWSKDGESNIIADLDNEMVNAALTSGGKVVSAQTWKTTVGMWYGLEKLALESITCSPAAGITCSADKATGVVTISAASGVSLAATNDVKITLKATKNGQQYSRDLTFTVAGVRGGADGSDAVLYSVVVSATSVSKDKDGNYSVSSVSCKRIKTVGATTSDTTEGELKYSRDGGAEASIGDNVAVSSSSFSKSLKFAFYVGGKLVDVETVPMIADGKDGESITADGHWESSKTPYAKGKVVSFKGGSFVALRETSNPPYPILVANGGYLRKNDGGYILIGNKNTPVNSDWQIVSAPVDPSATYWLDSPVGTINFTSTGTPSPSAFVVTCKQSVNDNVSDYNLFYLAARKYNGSYLAHVGATRSSQISVPATAGYTQFVVRAYKSASDANAWNNNYVCEKGIGVAESGQGSFKSTVFKRTNSTPSAPTGGSYNSPVPSGWSDGIPDGEAMIWASTRVFTTDCKAPQQSAWTTPKPMSDTADFDVEYSSVANPNPPSGHPNTNSQWGNTAGSSTLWMATSTKKNGVWSAWQVLKIKGEKGNTGATGAFPRDRGVFASGQTYVWNADYRDKIIYLIGGVYYNFLVRNYGASVTAAPTSANGDSNWEAMQKFENIATDTLFADGANVAGFMFKNKVLKSRNDDGETLLINGETGYFRGLNMDVDGIIRTRQSYMKIVSSQLNDGSIITKAGTYTATELPEGYSCVVQLCIPFITRAVLEIEFNSVNSNVKIAPNGDRLNLKSSVKFDAQGSRGIIIGSNEIGMTIWDIFLSSNKEIAVN